MNGPTKPPDISGSFATRFAAMVVRKWLKVFATIFLLHVILLSMSSPMLLAAYCFLKIPNFFNVFQKSEEEFLYCAILSLKKICLSFRTVY